MILKFFALIFIISFLFVIVSFDKSYADPSRDIDLVKNNNFPIYLQNDFRWDDTSVGVPNLPSRDTNMGECGCLISSLASVITYHTKHYSSTSQGLGTSFFSSSYRKTPV